MNSKTGLRLLSGRETSILRYHDSGTLSVAPWAKLFSQKLLVGIRFPPGKHCEDQAAIPLLIYNATKVAIIDDALYYYRIRIGSATNSRFSAVFFDNIEHMDRFMMFLRKKGDRKMAALARQHRNNTLALYCVLSRINDVEIPKRYRMNEYRIWRIMQKRFSHDKFTWFLHKVHPSCLRPYEYY